MGANPVGKFAPSGLGNPGDRNFNMPAKYVSDPTVWPNLVVSSGPNAGLPNWYHSNMREVAYPFLWRFYDELVTISNPSP